MKLNVVELYSGIGGMHFALQGSDLCFHVSTAIDINPVCNQVYKLNFPDTRLISKCLTSLSVKEFESFDADMVCMSPPCQPFTIVGKQKDKEDNRTNSLQHFLSMLPKCKKIPTYMLVENVKGFETSEMRNQLVDVLQNLDFNFQEFLLNPTEFSVPNSRLRYYLVAKRRPLTFKFDTQPSPMTSFPLSCIDINFKPCSEDHTTNKPEESCQESGDTLTTCYETVLDRHCSRPVDASNFSQSNCRSPNIGSFLEQEPTEYFHQYLVPQKCYKHFWTMDIVDSDSSSCCCFTKRYGRYIEGSGSVLQMNKSPVDLSAYRDQATDEYFLNSVDSYKLRFFTPREVANLMCFPSSFKLSKDLSNIQSYRILGNSINVHVVSLLLKLLTFGDRRNDF